MCIKTNLCFSRLGQSSPSPRAGTARHGAVAIEEKICIPVSTSSKFDKAMSIYKNHYSSRALKKEFNSATIQDEDPPSPTAITTLLTTLSTSPTTTLTSKLIPLLRSLPLPYKPAPMETTASIHSPLGNSIYSSTSVARRTLVLHGIRIFKALILVHEILRAREQSMVAEDEREELLWWSETVLHDIRYTRDGERGYGKLIPSYTTYLKSLLATLSREPSTAKAMSAHQNLLLANHAFRSTLLLDIQASNPLYIGAKTAALKLIVHDALDFGRAQEELLASMKRDGVQQSVIDERERVFEIRREEVVAFLRRCEGLELESGEGLDRGSEKSRGEEVEVEIVSEKLQSLKF